MFPRGVINFTAAYMKNRKIYVSSNDINALYEIDLDMKNITYLGQFCGKTAIKKQHVHIACSGKKLFFTYSSLKIIDIYNIETGMFSFIEIPERYSNFKGFWRSCSDYQYLYLIPDCVDERLLILNLETCLFTYGINWLSKKEIKGYNFKPNQRLCYRSNIILKDKKLMFHIMDSNIIAYYDVEKKMMNYSKLDLPDKYKIRQVFFDEKEIWLVDYEHCILVYKKNGDYIGKYKILEDKSDCAQLFIIRNYIYYMVNGKIYFLLKNSDNLEFTKMLEINKLGECWKTTNRFFYMIIHNLLVIVAEKKNDEILVLDKEKVYVRKDIKYPTDEDLWWYHTENKKQNVPDCFYESQIYLKEYIRDIQKTNSNVAKINKIGKEIFCNIAKYNDYENIEIRN